MDKKTSPLVFLHGWGTTSKIWQAQVAHFSPSWPVLTPDYLVQGSACSLFSSPLTLENLAEKLFTFCHQRSLPSIHLIGWSLGSMIAMEFTSRFPGQVASLTIAGGTPKFLAEEDFPGGMAKGELRLLRSRLKRDRLFAFASFYKLLFTDQEKRLSGTPAPGTPAPLMIRVRDLFKADQAISDQALLEGLDTLAGVDLRPVLPAIKAPVLILHGEGDRLCPVGAARYLHRHIPHSQLKIFPACGHLPFITREAEFNQTLENFLFSHRKPS